MYISGHRCLIWLTILHVKFLQYVFKIFVLRDKCSIIHLLDLKPKEEVQLVNHGHLKFPRHHSSKLVA
jgi:hypothetical protein